MKNKNILDELWDSYFSQERRIYGKEIEELLNDERTLLETFDKEQMSLYEKIENELAEINSVTEKESFIKGVRFGAAFMYETLCKGK